LEIAAGLDLDVVISDQRMPEMSGLAFLARIREIRREATASCSPPTRTWRSLSTPSTTAGLSIRAQAWDLDDMRLSIRRALEAKRLADEHERLTASSARSSTSWSALTAGTIGRLSAGIGHEFANAATLADERGDAGDELPDSARHSGRRARVDSGFGRSARQARAGHAPDQAMKLQCPAARSAAASHDHLIQRLQPRDQREPVERFGLEGRCRLRARRPECLAESASSSPSISTFISKGVAALANSWPMPAESRPMWPAVQRGPTRRTAR